MNAQEKLLKVNLDFYAKNTLQYAHLLKQTIENIQRLEELEGFIDANIKEINEFSGTIRPLSFVDKFDKIPEINKNLLDKVKSFIRPI